MSESNATDAAPDGGAARARYGWASTVVAVVFGLLYAYVLWDSIGNLVQLPKEYALIKAAVPWWLLILDVVLPLGVFFAAYLLGRARGILDRGLLYLVGLAVLSCATIASIAWVRTH